MTNLTDIRSNVASAAGIGTTVYNSVSALPNSGLTSGDQAFVESAGASGHSRLYISNGSGWYNVALINATPRLSLSSEGTIELATDGTATTITMTALDSDNASGNLTLSVESGGDLFKFATVSQDSSVVKITPRSSDSATALGFDGSATLTFKASDGISFASVVNTFTLAFTIASSSATTLLLKADAAGADNQVDISSSPLTITEAGNVTSTAFTPYHLGGYSTYFDGANDNITASNIAIAGNCTFEFWFYQDIAQSNAYRCILQASTYGSGVPFTIYTYGANINIWLSSGGSAEISTSSWSSYAWHHLVLVRNSGTWTLYIDGVAKGTSTVGGSYNFAASTDYRFGENHAGSYDWKGYIRDARFVSGTAVYTSAFTPPTEALTAISGTSLLTCHAPNIGDGSTSSHVIAAAGNTQTQRFSPYDYGAAYTKADHGGAVYFDGTGDYLTVPDGAYKTYGSGNFTIEMWFYPSAAFANNWLLADANAGGTTSTMSVGIFLESPNVKAQVITSAGTRALNGTTSVYQNTWNHMAVTRNGTALTLWINGVASHVLTIGGSETVNDSSNILNVGRCCVDYPYAFGGYISDLRIVKGTAVYTSAFTLPTAPLTAITNTQLLTCTNKNNIWDVGAGKVITKAGNTTASNTQRKFASSSAMYFDGTGDYLSQTMVAPLRSSNFTIEGWVWFNNPTGDGGGIFQTGTSALPSNANGCAVGLNGSTGQWRVYVAGSGYNASQTVTAQTWHHFAYVRNSGTIKLYADGNATSISVSNTTDFSESIIAIGGYYSTAYLLTGYIQDLKISKGIAHYTGNFTPPAAEFSG